MKVFRNESRAIRAAAERVALHSSLAVEEAEEAIREWMRALETGEGNAIGDSGFEMVYHPMEDPSESCYSLYMKIADFHTYSADQYVFDGVFDIDYDDSVPEQDRVDRPDL